MDLLSLSAVELATAIKAGKTTAVDAMQAVLDRIAEVEDTFHCYVTIDREEACRRAVRAQERIAAGELKGPLAGVPMAIKDNLCTGGVRTSCASRMLENFVPAYSAEAVLRLEAAGAVLVGKTNLDEFAFGSTTETSYFGVTRNPRNPDYVPGGSSGGSAAAVAAGECFFSLGSDTGGSVRQPASHCGVVGLKPTYGTVSRYGLVAFASSMDTIGPLTRTVEDGAVILDVIAGYDGKDSTSVSRADESFADALVKDVRGMKIGIPREYFVEEAGCASGCGAGGVGTDSVSLGSRLDEEVKAAVLKAAELLKANGAMVDFFDLGLTEYVVPTYYTLAMAEAASNLARYDGVKYGFRGTGSNLQEMYRNTRSEGFGKEVKRRIMSGNFVLSAGFYDEYYLRALKIKGLIKKRYDDVFQEYDCILSPVAPTTAPKLGEKLQDPLKMYLEDIYTVSVNLAGLPGISVPCGSDSRGLPIGLQLVADCFQEKKILRAAYTFEQLAKEVG